MWERWHAALCLAAMVASLRALSLWPLVATGLLSFAVFVYQGRSHWTLTRRFGFANAVTTLRLLLISWLASSEMLFGASAAALLTLVVVLDGVDGWLARRDGTSTAFGARFDMETDAFAVVVVGTLLYLRQGFPLFILLPGSLRYLYVWVLISWPSRNGEQPRSRLARWAFVLLMSSLIAALAAPSGWGVPFAALGTAIVCVSFLRSFAWSYARRQ